MWHTIAAPLAAALISSFSAPCCHELHRGILQRVDRNGSAEHQALQCFRRHIHDGAVYRGPPECFTCVTSPVSNLPLNKMKYFSVSSSVNSGAHANVYLHFQPTLALVGLELFRAGVSELRRGNEVGVDFQQLKINCCPRLRPLLSSQWPTERSH